MDLAALLAAVAARAEAGRVDVLDALWLAAVGRVGDRPVDRPRVEERRERAETDPEPGKPPAPPDPLPPEVAPPKAPSTVGLSLPHGDAPTVAVPAAPALRDPRRYLRALRPLRRRVPGPRIRLDEARTVDRFAATGVWEAVLRREPEPGRELVLVIDAGGAWPVLARAVRRLAADLARLGAFRRTRTLHLRNEPAPTLHAGWPGGRGRRVDVDELADPARRTVYMVVTDTTAAGWWTGAAPALLGGLDPARTVLVHTLPAAQWPRTGLGRAVDLEDPLDDEPTAGPFAVAELTPEALGGWSRAFSTEGVPRERTVRLPVAGTVPAAPSADAEGRVRHFLAHRSPPARRLAVQLAAVPSPALTPELVRLVREAVVPEAEAVHEAEFFLGGLLESADGLRERLDAGHGVFRFRDGARAALLERATRAEVLDVVAATSRWLEAHWAQAAAFRAALHGRGPADAMRGDDDAFARVALELVEGFGMPPPPQDPPPDDSNDPGARSTLVGLLERLGGATALPPATWAGLGIQVEPWAPEALGLRLLGDQHILRRVLSALLAENPREDVPEQVGAAMRALGLVPFEVPVWIPSGPAPAKIRGAGDSSIVEFLPLSAASSVGAALAAGGFQADYSRLPPVLAELDRPLVVVWSSEVDDASCVHLVELVKVTPCVLVAAADDPRLPRLLAERRIPPGDARALLGELLEAERLPIRTVRAVGATEASTVVAALAEAGAFVSGHLSRPDAVLWVRRFDRADGPEPRPPVHAGKVAAEVQVGAPLQKTPAASSGGADIPVVAWPAEAPAVFDAVGLPRRPVPGMRHRFPLAGVSLDLAWIPDGRFEMGSPEGVGHGDERPRHPVRITRAFWLGRTPVTQAEWAAVVRAGKGRPEATKLSAAPSHFKGEGLPVEQVSWFAAVRWCNLASVLVGRAPAYRVGAGDAPEVQRVTTANGFRLPTEAEWEYACRAGTETQWSHGDDEGALERFAWFGEGASGATHPVGEKAPNPWGLHDVHGNVREWCEDWYASDWYMQSPRANPAGPPGMVSRIVRGGSYWTGADWCRSAFRNRRPPMSRNRDRGFRILLPHPLLP